MWRKSLGYVVNGVCRAAPVASLRSNFIQRTSHNCLIRNGKYSLVPFVVVTEWPPWVISYATYAPEKQIENTNSFQGGANIHRHSGAKFR